MFSSTLAVLAKVHSLLNLELAPVPYDLIKARLDNLWGLLFGALASVLLWAYCLEQGEPLHLLCLMHMRKKPARSLAVLDMVQSKVSQDLRLQIVLPPSQPLYRL